jgi:ABC-type Fe3+ transport system permease subunit
VVAVVVIAVVAVFVGSSVSRIQWVHEKLQAFSQTLYYTAVGLASTVVVGVVVSPVYFLSRADGQTQAYAGYAMAGLVLAYGVFTTLGYVVDHYLLETWREYHEEHLSEVEET